MKLKIVWWPCSCFSKKINFLQKCGEEKRYREKGIEKNLTWESENEEDNGWEGIGIEVGLESKRRGLSGYI